MKGKYNALRYGDVFENWDQLMRLVRVTDSDEADPTTRKKKVLISSIIALYMALTLFRMSLSVFWITGVDHVMGQTVNQTGNVSKLIVAVIGVVLAQWTLYRLVGIRLILSGDMIFMQTLKSMVSRSDEPRTSTDSSIQQSDESREQKIRLVRIIHAVTVISGFSIVVCAYMGVTGYLWLNIQASETIFQMYCWVFWYVQDLILVTALSIDIIICPSMWFVVALNYRMDILSLTGKIQQLMQAKGMGVRGGQPNPLFREIRDEYMRLVREAERVNRMSSPILFVLVLCTTPLVCICSFIVTYSDNLLMQIMIPAPGCVASLFACVLLAIAADITSKSEQMHEVLCATAARQSCASLLSVQERRVLLLMMEHAASETNTFAMTTMGGQKYTMQSFVSFLIEVGLQYTLLFTLNQGIAFQ